MLCDNPPSLPSPSLPPTLSCSCPALPACFVRRVAGEEAQAKELPPLLCARGGGHFSENGSFVVKKEHRIVSGGALVPGAREPSPQRRLLPATKAEIQARVC